MQTSILTRLAPTQVELEIPLAPDEFEAAQQRAFGRLVRKVKLPGFRPGKVPRHLFEQTYGKDVIESEAYDDLAPLAYERALREHELDPLSSPEIHVMPREEGKPARLKVKVEVRPQFELPKYKGVEVDVPLEPVSDEQVEQSLATLARERATLVPADRPARLGDVVTIDYEGRIDGAPMEGASAKGQEMELSEDRYIPGFAAGIAGMRAGETKHFDLTFPSEYPHREFAGKVATFSVTVHEVKEVELPKLDDEFARNASDCQSLDNLREEIRTRFEALATARRRRTMANAVTEQLLARTEIPVPEGLVEREVESMLSEAARGEGPEPDQALRERFHNEAVSRVKGTFLIEAIARAEGIEATAEELRDEIESLARRYGVPADRMRKALKGRIESMKMSIVRGKTLDLLVDSAKAREATVRTS